MFARKDSDLPHVSNANRWQLPDFADFRRLRDADWYLPRGCALRTPVLIFPRRQPDEIDLARLFLRNGSRMALTR